MVEVIPCLAALLANSALVSLSVNTWYVPHTAFSIILLQEEGLSSSIELLVRISLTALLATSLAWPNHFAGCYHLLQVITPCKNQLSGHCQACH